MLLKKKKKKIPSQHHRPPQEKWANWESDLMSLTERYLCKAFKFQLSSWEIQRNKKKKVLREEKEGCEYLGLGTVLALVKIQPTELLKKLKSQASMKGIN